MNLLNKLQQSEENWDEPEADTERKKSKAILSSFLCLLCPIFMFWWKVGQVVKGR